MYPQEARIQGRFKMIAGAVACFLVFDVYFITLEFSPDTLRDYGWSLFLFAPGLIGFLTTMILGWKTPARYLDNFVATIYALIFSCCGLIALRWEGVMCILMATPLLVGFGALGAWIGHCVQLWRWTWKQRNGVFVSVLVIAAPVMILDRSQPSMPATRVVSSSVIIDAPPEKVWPLLVELHDMPDPDFWLFRMGIAYPVGVKTEGSIRHCLLSTGDMTEKIIEIEPGRSMKLKVLSTPPCMKETNPFGEVTAPHLNGHFESEAVEFRLEPLPGGKSRLSGTSWYHHRFAPDIYWSLWTDYVVKHVQLRVFNDISRRMTILRG